MSSANNFQALCDHNVTIRGIRVMKLGLGETP